MLETSHFWPFQAMPPIISFSQRNFTRIRQVSADLVGSRAILVQSIVLGALSTVLCDPSAGASKSPPKASKLGMSLIFKKSNLKMP